MKKILLLLIIILAFVVRLYRLDFPLADWHSWRQADTAAVSRNFIKYGFDLLHPRYDDLSYIPSGKENLQGYRFVEFPIYNAIHAFFYKLYPVLSLEVWGRLVSIFCSLGSLIFLYLIVNRFLGVGIALLTAFFYAVLPFNIYYSRTILPESMLVMTGLAMIFFWVRAIVEDRLSGWIFGILFAGITWLLKPFALVLLIPLLYLAVSKWGLRSPKWRILVMFIILSLLPFVLWRLWMRQFPEGIPYSYWLFNEAGIRFKGAWFYWLFAERIGRLILGYWGIGLLVIGLIRKPTNNEGFFFFAWLMAILAFFVIIAGGNVKHDYYQTIAIPIVCVFLAKGADYLLNSSKGEFSRLASRLAFIVCSLFMLAFSWYYIRDFFNINNGAIVEAGRAVDELAKKEAKVVAPYNGDTAFLYQTNRQGWPIWLDYPDIVRLKPDYFVSVVIDKKTEELAINYCLVKRTANWIIIDLTQTCPHNK